MQNKVVVVTGAFGVLGRAVAQRALVQGARVALIDFAPAAEESLPAPLALAGVDLTNPASAASAMSTVREKLGPIDALLNIAGGFAWQRLVGEGDAQVWERMFALNVRTAVNACRAALPHFAEKGAAIVNVGSAAAALVQASAGMGAYAAAKAGVHKLTESLAEELKGRVRVNAVLPSVIDTPANRAAMPNVDPAIWVAPDDLAKVILFLASDDAKAMTGSLVPVTGQV